MAKVKQFRFAFERLPADKIKKQINMRFEHLNESQRVDEQIKQTRIGVCAECKNLTLRFTCSVIGSCTSGKKDFYQMHLNRNNGGCPTGQW